MGQWFRDVGTVTGLCFRLLVSKKWFWLFLVLAGMFYSFLLSGLTEAAKEKSRLTLAVVWEREDPEAEGLVEFLKEQPILALLETTKEKGLSELQQGKAMAVLVIEEGYGDWLRGEGHQSRRKKPLTFYYQEEQEEAKILVELISGGILERYCLYQSYLAYQQTGLEEVSLEEYQALAKRYEEEDGAGALVEIRYLRQGSTSENALSEQKQFEPGNEAIYFQVVLGMLAGLLMLLILLLYAGGGERGAADRSGIGSIRWGAAQAGNILYVLLLEFFVGAVLCAVFFIRGSSYQASARDLKWLLSAGRVLFCFTLSVSLLFWFLREITGTREHFLAVGMSVCAILMILALIRVAASFLPEGWELIVRYSPGGWLTDRLLSLLYQ